MPAIKLAQKPGHMTLNGPLVEGYGAMIEWQGHQVMVVAPTAATSSALAASLSGHVVELASHVLVGQPPWYQNQTREFDLASALEGQPRESDPRPRSRVKVRVGDADPPREDRLGRRRLLW